MNILVGLFILAISLKLGCPASAQSTKPASPWDGRTVSIDRQISAFDSVRISFGLSINWANTEPEVYQAFEKAIRPFYREPFAMECVNGEEIGRIDRYFIQVDSNLVILEKHMRPGCVNFYTIQSVPSHEMAFYKILVKYYPY